jgi:hypothetical protein
MTTTRLSQARLLDPGLRTIYNDEDAMFQQEGPQFVKVDTMNEPYLTDYKMAFFGLVPQKPEGEAVTYDDTIPGTTVRYDPTAYGLAFRATKEAVRDERYGQLKRMTIHLNRSVNQTVNILQAAGFNNAFSTSFVGFTAGEALCSTAHALLGGGTYANRPSPDAVLSIAALQAAKIRMEKTVSERGFNTPLYPAKLVIPTELQYTAEEILKAPTLPYTNENTINVLKGAFGFQVWHFLTGTKVWFLIAKGGHDVQFFWRDKPEFTSGDDFDTGDSKHKVYFRCMESRFGTWRGIDGSNPP